MKYQAENLSPLATTKRTSNSQYLCHFCGAGTDIFSNCSLIFILVLASCVVILIAWSAVILEMYARFGEDSSSTVPLASPENLDVFSADFLFADEDANPLPYESKTARDMINGNNKLATTENSVNEQSQAKMQQLKQQRQKLKNVKSYSQMTRCDRCCSSMRHHCTDFGFNRLLPIFVLIVYSLLGAMIFYFIEHGVEVDLLNERNHSRFQLKERVWELRLDQANYTKTKLYEAVEGALVWYEREINCFPLKQKWSFFGAMFYVGTIYTTIGYGHIVPISDTGRVLTMVYATFGIPLVFIILSDLGTLMSTILFRVYVLCHRCNRWLCRNVFKRQTRKILHKPVPPDENEHGDKPSKLKIKRKDGDDDSLDYDEVKLHKIPILLALGVTVGWMIMCAAIFRIWEDKWSYFTAFYFFFVSLTTIGLGDTIPEHSDYLVMSFGLVLVGLALVSMCIQIAQMKVQQIFEEKLNTIAETYQKTLLEGEGARMSESELEHALQDIPPWLKPAFDRQRRKTIIEIWEERCKMISASTQTSARDWILSPEEIEQEAIAKIPKVQFQTTTPRNKPLAAELPSPSLVLHPTSESEHSKSFTDDVSSGFVSAPVTSPTTYSTVRKKSYKPVLYPVEERLITSYRPVIYSSSTEERPAREVRMCTKLDSTDECKTLFKEIGRRISDCQLSVTAQQGEVQVVHSTSVQ